MTSYDFHPSEKRGFYAREIPHTKTETSLPLDFFGGLVV